MTGVTRQLTDEQAKVLRRFANTASVILERHEPQVAPHRNMIRRGLIQRVPGAKQSFEITAFGKAVLREYEKRVAWFRVGDHVLCNGKGSGRVEEVGELRWHTEPEGHRSYRVNFGEMHCHECGASKGERREWVMGIHMGLTVSERKRREREGVAA